MREHKVELLAPGGSAAGIRAAVNAGADAVYAAGTMFGARAYADNPDRDGLLSAIDYCHLHGAKLYMTVNTLMKERELEGELASFLQPYYEHGLDAVLVQDLGALRLIRSCFPDLSIHASTQMSIQSVDGARLAASLGISRIVPARELSLSEIREIFERTGMEIECFIHGALCYSYSGQCLMSSLIGGRSGNRGRCAQPCRKRYVLTDEKGQRISGGSEAYLLSLKDICALRILPELIEAGIASFKIEGRMKRPEYAAGVTAVYRKYIDMYEEAGAENYHVDEEDIRILMDLYNRGGFSDGYYHVRNAPAMMVMDRPNHAGTQAALAGAKKGDHGDQPVWTAQEMLYPGDILESMTEARAGEEKLTVTERILPGQRLTAGNVRGLKRYSVPGAYEFRQGDSRLSRAGGQRRKPLPAAALPALRRTHCEKLLTDLAEAYIKTEKKEKIKGIFVLKRGMPAILRVFCGQSEAAAEGEIPSQALRRPLEKPDVIRQLSKTNDTPFVFEELDGTLEEDVFLPMGALNSLRRAALEQLEEKILASFRREKREGGEERRSPADSPGTGMETDMETGPEPGKSMGAERPHHRPPFLSLSVSARTQLEPVLRFVRSGQVRRMPVGRIILDSAMYMDMYAQAGALALQDMRAVKETGAQCFLALPYTWRAHVREGFFRIFTEEVLGAADALLLRCLDQIPAFSGEGKAYELAADSNLYVWNRRAAESFALMGIKQLTAPAELGRAELRGLLETAAPESSVRSEGSVCPESNARPECDVRFEVPVYGYQISMITAQCLRKNLAGCDHIPRTMYLTDERGARFPVRTRCGSCMNEIYNSACLDLTDLADEINGGGRTLAQSLRISFTVESGPETEQALRRWEAREAPADGFTRGHFRRGVE